MAKILVVEDDRLVAELLRDRLKLDQHKVELAHNGQDALDLALSFHFELLILDLGLPGLDGIEVLKGYRSKGQTSPVLILTGKNQAAEIELGLDAGADDYMTKPYDIRELCARVRALLRRAANSTSNVLTCGEITMDTARAEVRVGDNLVKMLQTEYQLLEFFLRHKGRVFSAEELLSSCWDSETEATEGAVRTYITRIRKKIDVEGKKSMLQSIYGLGYKLDDAE
ncbi:MAG: Response regulator transcription factor [Cyanobacteriota bacterium erpe_2018_sw_21hr_WHONDRS-SW48-000092_B_bin.40]|jgi:DNA-binding response OmpR family regulator|nr:Response regulator transcription factor [Cyanobacteriota bacterium erpe_2018_sw_21hr_WHONDRS-SW48-000092_B_bin.40]